MPTSVYFSFHYRRDSFRVQQVLNMGVLAGQPILASQDWEQVKRQGRAAVIRWIDSQMKGKQAVVVLVRAQTAARPWVSYEISKAWQEHRPLVGINIHGLSNGIAADRPGPSPFVQFHIPFGRSLANYVPLYDPVGRTSGEVYADISRNLAGWVSTAVRL